MAVRYMIESAAPYREYKRRKEENKKLKELADSVGYSLMGWTTEIECEKRACELQRFSGIQTRTSEYEYLF